MSSINVRFAIILRKHSANELNTNQMISLSPLIYNGSYGLTVIYRKDNFEILTCIIQNKKKLNVPKKYL